MWGEARPCMRSRPLRGTVRQAAQTRASRTALAFWLPPGGRFCCTASSPSPLPSRRRTVAPRQRRLRSELRHHSPPSHIPRPPCEWQPFPLPLPPTPRLRLQGPTRASRTRPPCTASCASATCSLRAASRARPARSPRPRSCTRRPPSPRRRTTRSAPPRSVRRLEGRGGRDWLRFWASPPRGMSPRRAWLRQSRHSHRM